MQSKVTRRTALSMASGTFLAGLLSACGAPPAPTTAPAPPAPATTAPAPAAIAAPKPPAQEAAKPVVGQAPPAGAPGGPSTGLSGSIEVFFPRTAVCRLCGAVDTWNQMNPNAKVVDKDVPWAGDKQAAALAAGQGGPDLYQSDPDEVQRDALTGKLLDLTDTLRPIEDQYVKYKLEQFRNPKNGKLYAFPWQVGLSMMIYRQDILTKLGQTEFPVTWTWEQQEQLAEKAKKDLNVNTGWLGSGAQPKDSNIFIQMLWQAGGTLVSKDWTKIELDSPAGIEIAQRLQRWSKKQLLFEGSFYTPALWGGMREGLLWNTTDPSWWLLGMQDNIKTPQDHAGDWRISPMPLPKAGGPRTANEGGGGLASPAYTKNPDLVRAFGTYATTNLKATVPTIKMGTVLSAKTSFSDPTVLDIALPVTGPQKIHKLYAELVAEVPSTFYYSAAFPEIRNLLSQNLLTFVKSDTPIEGSIKKLAEDARKLNERWLRLLDAVK